MKIGNNRYGTPTLFQDFLSLWEFKISSDNPREGNWKLFWAELNRTKTVIKILRDIFINVFIRVKDYGFSEKRPSAALWTGNGLFYILFTVIIRKIWLQKQNFFSLFEIIPGIYGTHLNLCPSTIRLLKASHCSRRKSLDPSGQS